MAGADRRLAAYGTLQPGQSNHQQMAGIAGTWRAGSVRGHLHQSGWGAAVGFPGLVADSAGPEVPVSLFESDDLVDHWPRLDDFEGEGYVRTTVEVATADGVVEAQIYLLAPEVT